MYCRHRTESWMSRDVLQSIAEQQNACMVRAQDCFIVLARIPAGAYTCATAAADNSVPERWSSTHDACHLTRHASHTYVCDHCMCRTSGYSWAGNDQQCRRCGQHQVRRQATCCGLQEQAALTDVHPCQRQQLRIRFGWQLYCSASGTAATA